LLLGDASARPEGLERALARAGFSVAEGDPASGNTPPDAVLISLPHADESLAQILDTINCAYGSAVPRIVVLSSDHRDEPARALALGADDALGTPVHFGELTARVGRRIQDRDGRNASPSGQLHAAMLELVEDVSTSVRAEEVLHTLVDRVGRALDLSHCSFVLTPEGAEHGRVLAEYREPTTRDFRLDLARYPEITEAIRTARPVVVSDVHSDPLFEDIRRRWAQEDLRVTVQGVVALPVSVGGRVAGVFLLRTRDPETKLTPAQIAFADNLARAAGRVLELARQGGKADAADPLTDALTGCGTPDALDVRIRQEFDRARRYALSFSLVLLDVDQLRHYNERLGAEAGDRVLADIGGLLRTGLRAPDFVGRYSGDEFAVVLPETSLPGARQSVNRVRERLGSHPFAGLDASERPQISAGIVTFPHPAAEQVGDLFALAEAALLRAKGQSGDRIGTAESVVT
jgi:diguanylate cyclase (GGDEF)-like protein